LAEREQEGVDLYRSTDEALAGGTFDAAIVATPAQAHVQQCREALSYPLPVMVEKPFTTSLAHAVDLVELADRKDVPLLVSQNYRYMRAHRTVKKVLDAGSIGKVGIVGANYYRVPHEMPPWLLQNEHSVMWGMAVHHLDAMRYVLSQRATRVLARYFTLPWNDPAPGATYDVLLDFQEGTRVHYSATYESSGHEYFEGGQEFYERFTGSTGTLHVIHRWLILCPKGGFPRLIRRGKRETTEEHLLLNKFAQAIKENIEPDCSGRDNLQTMAIVEACIRSAQEDAWINPQDLLDALV
jgi:predicted dehydrogenase